MNATAKPRLIIGSVAALVVVAAVGVFFAFRNGETSATGLHIGDRAPPFSAATIDGGHVSLAAMPGRPVVVTFGASWCGPCRKEYPLLAAALRNHPGKFDIIGVAYQDSPSLMRSLMRDSGAHWPVAADGGTIAARYAVHDIPATFFIASNGAIVAVGYGLTTRGALEAPLAKLLKTSLLLPAEVSSGQ